MRKTAFALLWTFVFVIPWEDFVQFPGLGSLPRLVGLVACATAVLHVFGRGSVRRPSWFLLLAAGFVLWAGLSSFWSIDPDATRARVLTYGQLAVLVWLLQENAWSPDRRRLLLEAYVLGASLAAIAVIYNFSAGISVADPSRFAAMNANPNYLGLTLALGVPMAWYVGLSQPPRAIAWSWYLYVPLAVTAILLTGSRMAAVAAVVALLIIPWTLGRLRFRTKAVLYGLAVGSIALASGVAPERSITRLATIQSEVATGHFGGRGEIWTAGLEVARRHPLAGVGAGAFGAAVEPMLGSRRSAHQTFLAIVVEQGFVGLALFLFIVVATLAALPRLPMLERRFSIVVLAVLATGSLSAAWDYQKALWFVLGMLASQVASEARRENTRAHRFAAPAPGRSAIGAC